MTDQGQERPIGQLFTHVYVERGTPTQDSRAFRRRLAGYLVSDLSSKCPQLQGYLRAETGLPVPYIGIQNRSETEGFFERIPLDSLLNIITLTWRYFSAREDRHNRTSVMWHRFVARALREENLGYTLDAKCGVHFLVDEEFERNRVAVLQGLDKPRYAAVRNEFESAHKYLDIGSQDTKAAVRSMFESLEILARLMVPDTKKSK